MEADAAGRCLFMLRMRISDLFLPLLKLVTGLTMPPACLAGGRMGQGMGLPYMMPA